MSKRNVLMARITKFDGTVIDEPVDQLWNCQGGPQRVYVASGKFKYDEEPFELYFSTGSPKAIADGGDVNFHAGVGAPPDGRTGSFKFHAAGKVQLELCPDGECFVNGKQVDDDKLIFAAFKKWLTTAVVETGPGASSAPTTRNTVSLPEVEQELDLLKPFKLNGKSIKPDVLRWTVTRHPHAVNVKVSWVGTDGKLRNSSCFELLDSHGGNEERAIQCGVKSVITEHLVCFPHLWTNTTSDNGNANQAEGSQT